MNHASFSNTIQISNLVLYTIPNIVVILLTSSFIVLSKWKLVMSGLPLSRPELGFLSSICHTIHSQYTYIPIHCITLSLVRVALPLSLERWLLYQQPPLRRVAFEPTPSPEGGFYPLF